MRTKTRAKLVPGFGIGVNLPMTMPALNFVAMPAAVIVNPCVGRSN
ncbi:MAG: hypothetical protein O7C69_07150 [Gammaproteobacteria bacterium]|nr:hypothetical protein [Gammaproteobacteria bacterium]MCZ6880803.1 hypothetical protein [Gammaproteobacteria bacterium]